jgi:hypothetical protein
MVNPTVMPLLETFVEVICQIKCDWRKLHNEELNDLYSSPTNFQAIKSRRIRWAGNVAWVGRREVCIGFWSLLAKAVGFFGRKNPQHAFLWKGSKTVCPILQICGMLKNPVIYRGSRKL